MNFSKESGLESIISRAVNLGQEFLDRSSGLSSQASSHISKVGSEGLRLTDDARDAVAAGLIKAGEFISTRRSYLRSPLFITLSVGAVAAAVAYYNREKIKAAATRAKEKVEPKVRAAASKVKEKASELKTGTTQVIEETSQSSRSTERPVTTH